MTAKALPAARLLFDELQDILHHGSVARRVATLRRVTDLFVDEPAGYSDEQTAVFDDVFHYLVDNIEIGARVLLSERLARHDAAPPRIIRTLAFDDVIEVAAPVLTYSNRLGDDALIENASTKSQDHLLAIAKRARLSAAVTDVLVVHGGDAVVETTASNHGAAFSDKGYDHLLARTENNDAIALAIGLQRKIPRPHYLKLIARASRAVRDRLEAAHVAPADEIAVAIKIVTKGIKADGDSRAAEQLVRSLFADDRLDESQLMTFARAGKFGETSASLACLAAVEIETVETIMISPRREGVMVLAKIAGLSWSAVKAILDMRGEPAVAPAGSDNGLEISQDSYERLRTTTAQQVLRFFKMENSATGVPDVA